MTTPALTPAAGNSYALEVDGQSITGVVAATGADWSTYKPVKIGSMHVEAGRHRVTLKPGGAIHQALMDLRAVALAPAGAKPKWGPLASAAFAPGINEMTRNPAEVARLLLDPNRSAAARAAAINANPQFAADIIAELTKDLAPNTPEEYKRIPWIWRVAIECGKRNDAGQIRRVLDVSLPKADAPLHDWQAVVIGGGIINGISQQNLWPAERIMEILADDADLKSRWQRSLDLASAMADNEKIPAGTRYDALRMLGVEPWPKRGQQLTKYLAKDTHAELQMGAVSAVADVNAPEAVEALITALPNLTDANRQIALQRLSQNPDPKVRERRRGQKLPGKRVERSYTVR